MTRLGKTNSHGSNTRTYCRCCTHYRFNGGAIRLRKYRTTSDPMWTTARLRQGGFIFYSSVRLMKQGVCFISCNKTKFERHYELCTTRNPLVTLWVTLPPSLGYVQSIVTFSLDNEPTRTCLGHGLHCDLERVGGWRSYSSSVLTRLRRIWTHSTSHSRRVPYIYYKIWIHSSCKIEYFVETHLCKLCVILQSRVLRVVCLHSEYRSATPLATTV